jgi:hypothetical protein
VWESEPDGFGIFGQRFDSSGAPSGPEFRVNTYTTGAQVLTATSRDASGNFIVVWMSIGQDGSGSGVFGQRFAGSGAPLGPEFRANTATTNVQGYPAVAADSAGNFVVVWRAYQNAPNYEIYGQRYDSAGVSLGGNFRINTYAPVPQNVRSPAVASDPSGNFVVVWDNLFQDGSGRGVFGQRYASSGATLGPEFRVNSFTPNYQYDAAVASDAFGNFIVVWQSKGQDGSYLGVFGQRYANSGAPLGPEFRINTYTTSDQNRPSVAADASGDFVVAWNSDDYFGYGVFAQRFASTGAPLGPEFRVNTFTTQHQGTPSIAVDGVGNFVVVWHSYLEDGSSFGVFGQRYSQMVPVELMHLGIE